MAESQTNQADLYRTGQAVAKWKRRKLNGKLRDELLSREWFSSVREAQVVIEGWRKFYNEERPHSSLGYLTPLEFKSRMENNIKLAIAVG